MKKQLTVVYGQAPDLSTSFQTRELLRHLQAWFDIRPRELPAGRKGYAYQITRLFHNYVFPALRRPQSEFVLYGNDGFADLRHWRGRRVLYWYDAPSDWSAAPPTAFKDRLRYQNLLAADEIFAVSGSQVRIARTLRVGNEGSVHYLPVGVDCEMFDPAQAARDETRRKLGFTPDHIVVGYLGYLGRWGNRFAGQVLLEAAPRLTDPLIRFLVIGSGPALNEWKEMVRALNLERRFMFAGFVPQADLPSYIAAADICVDTLEPGFHSEARSETKLKQYMAMGRACVATDIGENRVDLDNGTAGALAHPEPGDLAGAIQHLVERPLDRSRLGAAARQRARSVYDWQLLAKRMADILCRRS